MSEQSLQIMVISRVEVDTTWTGLAGVVLSQQHGSVAFAGNFRTVDPHVALDPALDPDLDLGAPRLCMAVKRTLPHLK